MIKKSLIFIPAVFAAVTLAFSGIFIWQAFSSEHLEYSVPFVGYGGTFAYYKPHAFGIPIYFFMMILGFCGAIAISLIRRKSFSLTAVKSIIIATGFLMTSYAGAKLLYTLEMIISAQSVTFSLDGLSLYGAIFLDAAIIPLGAKLLKIPSHRLYDFVAPLGLILLAAVRIGCFFNGCCGALTFWSGDKPIVLPVQLFEAALDFVLLAVLLAIEARADKNSPQKPDKKSERKNCFLYPILMIVYAFYRFLLEFIRSTDKNIIVFSNGQIYSILSFAVGISIIVLNRNKSNISKNKTI